MSTGHADSPPPQSFTVQTDPSGINRWHGGIVAIHAVLTVALVALTLLRYGFVVSSRGIHQDLDEVLQAAAFLSRGRVRVG